MCQLLNTSEHYTLAMMKFLQWGLRLSKWSWRSTHRLLNQGTRQVSATSASLQANIWLLGLGALGIGIDMEWLGGPVDHFPSPHVLKVEPKKRSQPAQLQDPKPISSTCRGDGMSAGSPKRPAMPARWVPLQTEVLQVGWSFGVDIWRHTPLSVSESLLEKSHVLPLKWPYIGSYDVQ